MKYVIFSETKSLSDVQSGVSASARCFKSGLPQKLSTHMVNYIFEVLILHQVKLHIE